MGCLELDLDVQRAATQDAISPPVLKGKSPINPRLWLLVLKRRKEKK